MPGAPVDLFRSGKVAENQEVRRAAVVEAEGHPRELRVDERALALDEEKIAASGAFDHEALGRTGQEVRDHGIDGNPPSRDGDSGLARWNEDGPQSLLPSFSVELDRNRFLADGAVRADG